MAASDGLSTYSRTGASLHESIISWLSTVSSPATAGKKHVLAEVDLNVMPQQQSRSSKRRRQAESDEEEGVRDLEATPRATDRQPRVPSNTAAASSTTTSNSQKNMTGGSSRPKSPIKHLTATLLRPQPIILRNVDEPQVMLPNGLAEMLSVVERLAQGLGVIHESCQVRFLD